MIKVNDSFNKPLALTDVDETVISPNQTLNVLNGLLNL